MKNKLWIVLIIFIYLFSVSFALSSTDSKPIYSGLKYYSHYSNGYYWIAYYNGTCPVIASSPDKTIWTIQDKIFSRDGDSTDDWGIRFNNNDAIAFSSDNGLYDTRLYLHLTLDNDGNITKNLEVTTPSANHRLYDNVAFIGPSKNNVFIVSKRGSSDNYFSAQIGYNNITYPNWQSYNSTSSWGATNLDKEITTYDQSDKSMLDSYTIIVRKRSSDTGDVTRHQISGFYYNNSSKSFLNMEPISDNSNLPNHKSNEIPGSVGATLLTNGDIDVVYITKNGELAHKKVIPNSLGSTIISVANLSYSATNVFLSRDNDDNLYAFYSNSTNQINYIVYNGTSWSAPITLKSDSSTIIGAFSGFESEQNSEIGIVYANGSVPPYDVIFQSINTSDISNLTFPPTADIFPFANLLIMMFCILPIFALLY